MRILRFIPYFTRAFGGPVNHARYLTRELNDRGHEHAIYTTDLATRDGLSASFTDDEFDVRAFRARQLVGDYFLTPGMIRALRRESGYDLIHAHCYRNFQTDLAALLARQTNTPLVVTAHGTIRSIDRVDRVRKGLYDIGTARSALRWADRCVAVAETEVRQYTASGVHESDVAVIPHGVDVDRFSPNVDATAFVRRHGLDGTRFVLYAGRLHEQKGIQHLLPAIERLAREYEDLALMIAGPDYGYERELRVLCRDLGCAERVRFVGHLDQETLVEAYNAAYLVCYPSKLEIFGHVLTEASVCGTPCVATRWGAAEQIVTDGVSGRLLDDYGDVEAITETIRSLLERPERVAEMGRRARTHVVANFSWANCATEHERVYRELLG